MKRLFILIQLLNLLILSCGTMNGIRKTERSGIMCGLIINENNQPVSGFRIVCRDGLMINHSAVTNESGFFFIENLHLGKIIVKGEKEMFSRVIEEDFNFYCDERVYCWQVEDINSSLQKVKVKIISREYEEANKLLDELCVEKKSWEEKKLQELKLLLIEKQKEKNQEGKKNDAIESKSL